MANNLAFVCGDGYQTPSGLRLVATNLSRILQEKLGYKVVYLSLTNAEHQPVDNAIWIGNSTDLFDEMILKYRPSLVVVNHDPWASQMVYHSKYRHTYTLCFYAPCESIYYAPEAVTNVPDSIVTYPDGRRERRQGPVQVIPIAEILKNADYVIGYNEFGKKGLESMGVKVRRTIQNGINRTRTFKIENRELIMNRRRIMNIADDEVLFMHVSRNSVRKRQDIVLESWYKFLKLGEEKLGQRPKAKLYMHCDQISMNGFVLPSIINRLKINDTVMMPNALNFSEDDLNIFYNCADVYISFPAAEGFGLPVAEAMACGKPIIYGAFGGHTTFCEGAGIAVPPVQFISAQNIDMVHAVINSRKAAEAMLELYLDKQKRETYGVQAQELVKPLYWDVLDDQFTEAFQECLAEAKRPFVFAKRVA